jgi:flagellar biosynthesis/type III secretory pathway chaperone
MTLDTDRLAELVRRKHDCLAQLHELGAQQCAVVDSGDVNDLLRLLGAKQHVINQLQTLERDLDPFRPQNPDERVWRSSAEREQCAHWLQHSETLFTEIMEQERKAEQLLKRRRDDSLDRLRDAYAGEQVRKAYLPEMPTASSSFDLTSEV